MPVKINLMPKKSGESFARRGNGSFFFLFSSVFFIVSLAVFSTIFIWKTYFLQKDLLESKAENDALNAEISEKIKSPLLAANMKADSAEKILASHLYPSKFYRLFESLTLKNIFYKDFSLDAAVAGSSGVHVKVKGEAESFNSLAKQLEIFRESEDITGVSFDNAQINKSGKIDFSVELSFRTASIGFFSDGK